MPQNEHPSQGNESLQGSEQEQESYITIARFTNEQQALITYTQVQQLIFGTDCDLSAYRFLLEGNSHVAVLGAIPTAELDQHLQTLLSTGESVTLPDDIKAMLFARRKQASGYGTWVEGHYRPGKHMHRPKR